MSWGMVRFFLSWHQVRLCPGQDPGSVFAASGSRIPPRISPLAAGWVPQYTVIGPAAFTELPGGFFFGRACYSGASAAVPPLHFRHPACSLPFSPVSFLSC